jgi:DNA-binding MarR family transcriptional regulator
LERPERAVTFPVPSRAERSEQVRRLLHRWELAGARRRTALARELGVADTEMLALAHVDQHGELAQGLLATLLDLSSGGTAALVQRLEQAGHVERRGTDDDKRLRLVRLSTATAERMRARDSGLATAIDRLLRETGEEQAIAMFLEGVAAVGEGERRPRGDGPPAARPAPAAVTPARWG